MPLRDVYTQDQQVTQSVISHTGSQIRLDSSPCAEASFTTGCGNRKSANYYDQLVKLCKGITQAMYVTLQLTATNCQASIHCPITFALQRLL